MWYFKRTPHLNHSRWPGIIERPHTNTRIQTQPKSANCLSNSIYSNSTCIFIEISVLLCYFSHSTQIPAMTSHDGQLPHKSKPNKNPRFPIRSNPQSKLLSHTKLTRHHFLSVQSSAAQFSRLYKVLRTFIQHIYAYTTTTIYTRSTRWIHAGIYPLQCVFCTLIHTQKHYRTPLPPPLTRKRIQWTSDACRRNGILTIYTTKTPRSVQNKTHANKKTNSIPRQLHNNYTDNTTNGILYI